MQKTRRLTGRTRRRPALAYAVAALLAAPAISPAQLAQETGRTTVYGETIELGRGTARSYLVLDGSAPVELGVALSEAALSGLPTEAGPGGMVMPDGHRTFEHLLSLPAANPTPFTFVELDWNPGGHEPPGTYDRPHFDFHFYTITEAERNAIAPSDPTFQTKAERFPAREYLPAGYVTPRPVLGVPRMGVHWVDPGSPELNGEPFSRTFIYGSWDGKLIFAEPMVTKEFLETRPDFRAPVATAERYEPAGHYPAAYRVYWDAAAGEYRVALADFARR